MIKMISVDDIPPRKNHYKFGSATDDLKEFVQSGLQAVEIILPAGRTAAKMAPAYCNTIARLGCPARQMVRDGRLFLVRVEGGHNA